MLAAGAPNVPLSIGAITDTAAAIGLGGSAAILAVAAGIAITLQPLQFRLVQLLEGYWPARGAGLIFRLGVWFQARRRERFVDAMSLASATLEEASPRKSRLLTERAQVAEDAVRTRFPAEDRLLPTSLGNVLRSAEDRLGKRYGIDTVVIWPRLFRLLPDTVARDIDDEVTQLDVSARLAVTWFATALASSAVLLVRADERPTYGAWWSIPVALGLLSRLSYRGAIESALAHSTDIEVGLDLYRGRVLAAMHLPEPARLTEEQIQFKILRTLFTTYREHPELEVEYLRPARVVARRRRPRP